MLQRYAHITVLQLYVMKWLTECHSYFMHASYRAAIFACCAWHHELVLPDLPYTVHASNPTHADDLLCLQLHLVGSQFPSSPYTHTQCVRFWFDWTSFMCAENISCLISESSLWCSYLVCWLWWQGPSAFPHGPIWNICSIWSKSNWFGKRGCPAEFTGSISQGTN
jgi:hypothetical protein